MNLFEKLNRLDDSLVESNRVVKKKKLTESYENTLWQDKPIAYEGDILPKHMRWLFNDLSVETNFFDFAVAHQLIKENGITAEQIEQLENVYNDFKQGAASMNDLAKRASQILNLPEKEGLSNEVEHIIYDTVQDAYSVGTPDETLWKVIQQKLRGKKYDKIRAKDYFNMCLEQGSDEWYDDYDDHYDYDDDIDEMLTESTELTYTFKPTELQKAKAEVFKLNGMQRFKEDDTLPQIFALYKELTPERRTNPEEDTYWEKRMQEDPQLARNDFLSFYRNFQELRKKRELYVSSNDSQPNVSEIQIKNSSALSKLTESYGYDELTEFINWIQEYRNGALWDDFVAEFDSEEDPDIDDVLSWLETFDEDAYLDYTATEDEDLDEVLTESEKNLPKDEWQLIKSDKTYDPEGLDIHPTDVVLCSGTEEKCREEFNKLVVKFRMKEKTENPPQLAKVYKYFIKIEKLTPDTLVVYYPQAQSKDIYRLRKVN